MALWLVAMVAGLSDVLRPFCLPEKTKKHRSRRNAGDFGNHT